MAISLRLSRGGAKKRPYYRIVVADSRSPRDGKYLEQVGTYNPVLAKGDENRVKLNEDRIRYWLGVGAQPTDRVERFLDAAVTILYSATVGIGFIVWYGVTKNWLLIPVFGIGVALMAGFTGLLSHRIRTVQRTIVRESAHASGQITGHSHAPTSAP